MSDHVRVQIALLVSSVGTVLTSIGLLLRVGAEVHHKAPLEDSAVVAVVTSKRLLPGVRFLMVVEGALRLGRVVTQVALVRFGI